MIPRTNDFSIGGRKLGGLPASLAVQARNSLRDLKMRATQEPATR